MLPHLLLRIHKQSGNFSQIKERKTNLNRKERNNCFILKGFKINTKRGLRFTFSIKTTPALQLPLKSQIYIRQTLTSSQCKLFLLQYCLMILTFDI